eukprot:356042_1
MTDLFVSSNTSQKLVYGYIRQHDCIFIPTEITQIIFLFYFINRCNILEQQEIIYFGQESEISQLFRLALASRLITPKLKDVNIISSLTKFNTKGILLYGTQNNISKQLTTRKLIRLTVPEAKIFELESTDIVNKYHSNYQYHDLVGEYNYQQDSARNNPLLFVLFFVFNKVRAHQHDYNMLWKTLQYIFRECTNILVIGFTMQREKIPSKFIGPKGFAHLIKMDRPNEQARTMIFDMYIHRLKQISSRFILSNDINSRYLAANTECCGYNTINSIIRCAITNATQHRLHTQIKPYELMHKITNALFYDKLIIYIKKEDFDHALEENTDKMLTEIDMECDEIVSNKCDIGQFSDRYSLSAMAAIGFLDVDRPTHSICVHSQELSEILKTAENIINRMRKSNIYSLNKISLLLFGEKDMGKTFIASHLAYMGEFEFMKRLDLCATEIQNHLDEHNIICKRIWKVFQDAYYSYKSSIIIIDNIDVLLEIQRDEDKIGDMSNNGNCKQLNSVLKTLLMCIKKKPMNSKIFIIITCNSNYSKNVVDIQSYA